MLGKKIQAVTVLEKSVDYEVESNFSLFSVSTEFL